MAVKHGLDLGGALPALLDQAVVAQHIALAANVGLDAAAGQRREVAGLDTVGREAGGDGVRHRVVGVRGQRGSDVFGMRPGQAGGQHLPLDEARLALSDGAGLVERDSLYQARLLQVSTPLDQDAPLGRRRQTADDGDRRRDHEGARAGDDQQHQRLVDRSQYRPAEQPGTGDGDGERQHEHGRRVDGREAVNEALRGCTAALGLLDGVDDAGQRRLRRCGGDAALDRAGLVDGAGEDRIAGPLVHRQALASDGRLVQAGAASGDDGVHRDALAGSDSYRGADRHVTDRHCFPGAVRLPQVGGVG